MSIPFEYHLLDFLELRHSQTHIGDNGASEEQAEDCRTILVIVDAGHYGVASPQSQSAAHEDDARVEDRDERSQRENRGTDQTSCVMSVVEVEQGGRNAADEDGDFEPFLLSGARHKSVAHAGQEVQSGPTKKVRSVAKITFGSMRTATEIFLPSGALMRKYSTSSLGSCGSSAAGANHLHQYLCN